MSDTREHARRLVSLAIGFENATQPLSLDHIHQAFYGSYPRRSFYTVFRRDRETLATCGLRLRELDGDRWEAEPSSFAGDVDADPDDLAALDLVCLQLASDPSFPYRQELRHALLKLDRRLASSPVSAGAPGEEQTAKVVALLHARSERHPVRVRYVDASGIPSDRTLCVLGEFGLRGHVYFVAYDLNEDGSGRATTDTKADTDTRAGSRVVIDGTQHPSADCTDAYDVEGTVPTPHVFRDDRFRKVKELDGPAYRIPEGFRADDWRRLPFQIGKGPLEARLLVPDEPDDSATAAMGSHGMMEGPRADGRRVWRVPAADLDALAAWAVAEGFTPLEPESLVRAYRAILGEASHA